MKIAILAAGGSLYFPLFFDKPKCIYHLDGQVQLGRVIDVAKKFVSEEDIIVVGGYKYKYIEKFLNENYPSVQLKLNHNHKGPAIFSFRKAIENVDDDVVFMFGDENIAEHNVRKICESKRPLAIMCHDTYYYYSVGIMKLRKDYLHMFNDENYLSMDYMKEIYCFANKKEVYDGNFGIDSGICIGYMIIDFVRRIGKITSIENPVQHYHGEDIDFIHFNPEEEYIPDVDHFYDTDEYKTNLIMRFYSDYISDTIKKVIDVCKKLKG